jgi:hypothetical protein
MKTASKRAPEASSNETKQTTVAPASAFVTGAAAVTRKKVVAKPKATNPDKSVKAELWPPRRARAVSDKDKLVCRYCGSDDLAPSFKKRRDARCRACFKQRYGSAVRGNKLNGVRKARAAK